MTIKTIIIEDEQPARDLVKNYLSNFTQIEVIEECSDGFSGLKAVNELKPDLIFLDIQMPKLTGFEVLELLEHKPVIIFTTAYDQYALKAFEQNATDYLLKPFSKDRFSNAIEKAFDKIKHNKTDEKEVKELVHSFEENSDLLSRIAIRNGSKINVVSVDSIYYLEADGDYVSIHTREGKYLKEKTMKYFESHLDSKQFVRIHRSFIVNVNEIIRLENYDKDNHIAILKNNDKLKVSANGYKLIREILKL